MRAGHSGRVTISWKQTELDGLEAAPVCFMTVGAAWSWRGQAVMLAGAEMLNIEKTGNAVAVVSPGDDRHSGLADVAGEVCARVVLTNGAQSFSADMVRDDKTTEPTLVFDAGCPPRDQDFWVCDLIEYQPRDIVVEEPTSTVLAFPTRTD